MASPFKSGMVRNLSGLLDRRRQPDEVGLNNFRLIMNSSVRGRGRRCRRGGWRRFLHDEADLYNNEDLHDQLINLQFRYDSFVEDVFIPGGFWGYAYPYWHPSSSTPENPIDEEIGEFCEYAPDWFDAYNYPMFGEGYGIAADFTVGYPYEIIDPVYGIDGCDSGYPYYYPLSHFTLFYTTIQPAESTEGYGFGDPVQIFTNPTAYKHEYCGDEPIPFGGCREAITHITTVGNSEGRQKLIAATKTRIYSLNVSSGNWAIVADGLGHRLDEAEDCDSCSQERFLSANLDNTVVLVNGVNRVLAYSTTAGPDGCNVWRAKEIEDLITLNVSSAGTVGAWKGFVFIGDIQMDGFRHRNRIIWSDFADPFSFIPDDDSIAGFQDLGNDETILRIEPLNDFLFIFTDKSIYRAVLIEVAGTSGFAFEEIYRNQDGSDMLRYKYSLVNTGDAILYWSHNRLVAFTSFDRRPIEPAWMRAFSSVVFEGLSEPDLEFGPINVDRCDLFTGGWNPATKEVWWSWATDDNTCPNMSLCMNVTPHEEGADLVDHGFTAFRFWDGRPAETVIDYLESLQICPRESLLPETVKEGDPALMTSEAFSNPPAYLWNAANDLDQEAGENSLCKRMESRWLGIICTECRSLPRYVMADASDRTLKEYTDDEYARESLVGDQYTLGGYTTVLQSGSEHFSIEEDKIVDLLTVTYTAEPQTTPNMLFAYISSENQPTCRRWKQLKFYDEDGDLAEGRELRCLTDKDEAGHDEDHTRADSDAKFPTQIRGKYLAYRIRISGTGGGSCFSRIEMKVAKDEKY